MCGGWVDGCKSNSRDNVIRNANFVYGYLVESSSSSVSSVATRRVTTILFYLPCVSNELQQFIHFNFKGWLI